MVASPPKMMKEQVKVSDLPQGSLPVADPHKVAERGEIGHELAGGGPCDIAPDHEQRVKSFCSPDRYNFVGKPPEENGHDVGAPKLRHHIEKGEGPVPKNCD